MNKIDIQTAKKNIHIDTAECWDELSREQFIEVVRNLTTIADGTISDDLLRVLLGIDNSLFKLIPPVQRYYLKETFSFLQEKPEIETLLIQSFEIDGITYVGYQPKFSNTTWEEFIFADQYFMKNDYTSAIAVLFREKKENYDEQSDIRIPFAVYGMPKRLKALQKLNVNVIAAIALNYRCLREKHIAEKYSQVFSYKASSESSEESFSWLNVHRNILSENFFEEDKFYKSFVHAVLHRMNYVLEENRKKPKK
jgi:hypothetical protein